MTLVIFSKDRALQLDAFLRSYAAMAHQPSLLHVLYRATTERHRLAYIQVFDQHASLVEPHLGDDLKTDLLAVLPKIGCVTFFVDDIVFIRPFDIEECPGLSLRLGLHLTRCYPLNTPQSVPPYELRNGYVEWIWANGDHDWGYPMSLDGHVLNLVEIRSTLASATYATPTRIESALSRLVDDNRVGVCYPETRLVNIPWNRVQDENLGSRHTWCSDLGPDRMLAHWETGYQIALADIYDIINESCHQELPLILEARL